MKNLVLTGLVLLMSSVLTSVQASDLGELVVDQPLVFKDKKSTQLVEVGSYKASMNVKKKGFLISLSYLNYKIETSSKMISGSLRVGKDSVVKKQSFSANRENIFEEEVVSEENTEVRSCIYQTIYSQDNCRIVYETTCDSFGNDCDQNERIKCDQIANHIYGENDVVFVKTKVTIGERILFRNNEDKSLLATYTSPLYL